MALQTTYASVMAAAYAGMVANTEHVMNQISRTAVLSEIGFGKVVVQGAADRVVRLPDASNLKFVGISVRDQAGARGVTEDTYAIGDSVPVLTKGVIWVVAGENVAAGDPVYFLNATGALMKTATNATLIAGARFEASASSGALVPVRLG